MTDKDNNTYSTVSIGAQCWTTTNLKVTKYDDGSLIPDLTSSTSNPWATSGARTEYVAGGVAGYVGTFGYLYNWYAVNDLRKLCPAGWHVPTDAEWTIMIQTLDPSQLVTSGNVSTFTGAQSSTAGTLLKKNDALWTTNTGTNTSGFTALPGGCRFNDGSFSNIRDLAFFWSATESESLHAWYRSLGSSIGNVRRSSVISDAYNDKLVGTSVRCLKD